MERTNLAGRAGSWSAANWKKALFGAFAAAVVAMGIGQATGHVQMRDSQAASGENAKALAMREAGNFKQPAQESVLVKSATYTAKEPIVQAAIAGVVQNLARQPNVTGLRDPRTLPGNGGLVSRDGHFVLIQFDVRGDPDKAQEKVAPIIAAVAAAQSANPGISIREVGEASANYELNKTFNKDFGRAELMTVPITLIILLAAFGALVAAGLPVLLAIGAVLASLGLFSAITHLYPVDYQSSSAVMLLDRVLRHPAASIALAGGLLVLAATPVMSMHTKLPSFTDMPRELPIVKTYKAVVAAFPGAPTPAAVVVRAPNVRAPVVATAIRSLERRAVASGQMFQPITMSVSPDKTVADIAIPLAGNGDNAASLAALRTLRSVVLPATLGNVSGVDYAVAGQTAGTHDFNELMKARMPWVILFVLALAFVLLLATFRSVVIPLTAIALNVLSVGAAYGLLVLIFQHTWAQGVLQFTSNRSITSWLPMFLFVVLFGLSMDYHVFILSRIKELHDGGLSTEEAVSRGIRRTAGTVTSAAIIMVAVFAIFGTLRLIMMKQMGVGLGLAVLIDATVIRGVLLPATMKLLGEWNWYMPRWLDWVPRLTPEDAEKQPPLRPLAH